MANTISYELQMQSKCVQWFWNTFPEERRMLHCNMNNSFNRILGAIAKALGVAAGVSDLEFVDYNCIWFIELKRPGGTQSPEQKEFMYKVKDRGHKYIIIYSFEEFKQFIYSRFKIR